MNAVFPPFQHSSRLLVGRRLLNRQAVMNPREHWCGLKAQLDQALHTEELKPGLVALLEDCNASTSMVVEQIIESEYADLFYPVVSMGTYVGVYSQRNWTRMSDDQCYDDEGPHITFRTLPGKRLLVAYHSPSENAVENEPETDVDQMPELPLSLGIAQLKAYLARMKEETARDA